MAGQLTLDQHIGVRIPGGQPSLFNLAWLTVSIRGSVFGNEAQSLRASQRSLPLHPADSLKPLAMVTYRA